MDFKNDEVELVYSYWNDYSQDVDFISFETGIEKEKVKAILDRLKKTGKIKDIIFNESKVISFDEMLDIDDYFGLGLDKISTDENDKEYFFQDENVNKNFQKGPIGILVRSKHFMHDSVVLDLDVSYMDETYPIFMYYDRNEQVHFSTPIQPEVLDIFFEDLGENLNKFFEFSQEVLDKIIPFDFWETRAKFN